MWNLETARSRYYSLIAYAEAGRPQHVSRRGKPAVAILSEADYSARRQAARQERRRFAQHLLAFPAEALPGAEADLPDRSL